MGQDHLVGEATPAKLDDGFGPSLERGLEVEAETVHAEDEPVARQLLKCSTSVLSPLWPSTTRAGSIPSSSHISCFTARPV